MTKSNSDVGVSEEPKVSKVLELSTAHISAETNQLLQERKHPVLVVYEKKDSGYLILIPGDEEDQSDIPSDLVDVLRLAENLDCEWVMLDRDYDVVDGLPTFDW